MNTTGIVLQQNPLVSRAPGDAFPIQVFEKRYGVLPAHLRQVFERPHRYAVALGFVLRQQPTEFPNAFGVKHQVLGYAH